jgi:hypothetical protein
MYILLFSWFVACDLQLDFACTKNGHLNPDVRMLSLTPNRISLSPANWKSSGNENIVSCYLNHSTSQHID